ncbi:hypothetical protein MLD63_17045 [Paracoccus sp. TK19116]|uniref:Uncharacterized protein n=1 Tax=Paracoccus albicereus TaxID=2922394 RepID=A0ABT1MUX0_9RHOB|nr:hypothetical protein [Paracoccus albicereus]MCQ0972128.1 hypothetical protein [Paracoccus albicereus]
MLLERTIRQLHIGPVTPARAQEMGHLGYLQWLGALRGTADYRREVARALTVARPMAAASPAVAIFCDLLERSAQTPIAPLPLSLPPRQRRGGARARRAAI